jgi:hypothetical protein
MPKELSYKELFPNLNDLTLRNVVQTETGWVVEAKSGSRNLRRAGSCWVNNLHVGHIRQERCRSSRWS